MSMAANKFATMLHRNTSKITVIIVYAVLEWILILLLFFNSFFTYLIVKFANYFGLKPPCLWCSRVDHILEPGNNTISYRDLICDTHAAEISKLSYCSNHKKLAESRNMCEGCSSSPQTWPIYNGKSIGMSQRIAFISWVSVNKCENDEDFFSCSCCNESFSSKLHPPYVLLKPSWGVLDYNQKADLIIEAMDDNNSEGENKEPGKPAILAICSEDDCEIERTNREDDHDDEEVANEHQILPDHESLSFREATEDSSRSVSNLQSDKKEATENEKADDNSLEIINPHCNNRVVCEFYRPIPIELTDFLTIVNQGSCISKEEDLRKREYQYETLNPESQIETQVNVLREAALMKETDKKASYREYESLDMGMDDIGNSSVLNAEEEKQDLIEDTCEQVVATPRAQTSSANGNDVKAAIREQGDRPAPEEEINRFEMMSDQTKSKTLISTEMPNPAAFQPTAQEPIPSVPCIQDHSSKNENGAETSIGPDAFSAHTDLGPNHKKRAIIHEQPTLVDKNQVGKNHHLSISSYPNEAEEEKLPDTPTSIENLHYLHKKLLIFEKRESGMEDSLDGSVVSEMEGGDAVLTIEKLKAAVKNEQKALSALYAELEEERCASAIAANHTMAMITRLQEEKAAMQMEALQYQRMMEEQSEYDQEALHILNELMIKREKEKKEIEKELEAYRDKVLDYEMKEEMRMMRRTKDGNVRSKNYYAHSSSAGDRDELSIDLNHEARGEDSSIYSHQESSINNTPADGVLNLEEMTLDCVKHMSTLDESLAEFEEERLSILDQIKVLEETLLTLDDDEEFCKEVKSKEPFSNDSVLEFDKNCDSSIPEENGVSKDLSEKRYPERRTMAKRLLPFLDAADHETEEGLIKEEQAKFESVEIQNYSVSKFELDSKKVDIVEDVDHVYERLQALETDGEFLKHCMSSVDKGDRGMDVLQEILQHLRDLRAVELRLKNISSDSQG